MSTSDFDAITLDDLKDAGSLKWTLVPDTIGAFVAEMDFGVAPVIQSAISGAVARGLTGYLPQQLVTDLADATSRWYAESYGWEVPPARVRPVPDVISAFEATIDHFTTPGSAVILPTPAYMPFLMVPQMHGRRVIEVPSIEVDGRFVVDLDGIARAFDDGGELLVVCNPHNPLGTVATRDELLAIADLVAQKGGRVFADEIHAPLVYAPAQHVPYASISDAAAAHTITAASASKAWNLAGLKCAQVILSSDADAKRWKDAASWAEHGTSTLGVVANIAAYAGGRPWLDEVLGYLEGNRDRLVELVAEHLPGVGVTVPEGTYIALLDFRGTGLSGDLGQWFRRHAGVTMTDGAACGEAGVGHARFVFALPQPVMEKALIQMGRAMAQNATTEAAQ